MSVIPTTVKAVTTVIDDLIAAAIGSDTVTFATNHVWLVDQPFVPSISPELPVPPVDADGIAEIVSSGATLLIAVDTVTGDKVYRLKPPAGGWYWVTTGATTLPRTIYGWYWTKADDTTLIVSGLLDARPNLDAVGQEVEIDHIEFRLPPGVLR